MTKVEGKSVEEIKGIKEIKEEIKGTKEIKEDKQGNVQGTWIDSYKTISKMWEDSYLNLYKPWLESTRELFQKATEVSRNAVPENYKEFYDEWLKVYQKHTDKIPTYNKETLEKLLISAEESNKIYKSWIAELEENSKKTRDVLKGDVDPIKYKAVYDLWIKTYGKIFDELLALPFRDNIKEIFQNYTGLPDIYTETFLGITKLWKDSYTKLYQPWIESVQKLYEKSVQISKGENNSDSYKEFYCQWLKVYGQTYGNIFGFPKGKEIESKDAFKNFVESTDVYINVYKSWINTLDKISVKAKELTRQDPSAYKDIYELWAKAYEKSFDFFFENTPTIKPFKNAFEPVKDAVKLYANSFSKMPIWTMSECRAL